MSETTPGGAYLSADRKTWHDANGNVIPAPGAVVNIPDAVPAAPEVAAVAETETVTTAAAPAVAARRGGRQANTENKPATTAAEPDPETDPKG